MNISAVIITKNEEKHIAEAIRSVLWCDEVLVVDSGSTDGTARVAESLGARVIAKEWLGFGAQKRFAAEQAKNDWILSIDADERVPDALKTEIEELLKIETSLPAAFRLPRLAIYMSREIRHCGWYPDWQKRVFDRRRANWSEDVVHESVQVRNGESIGTLKNDLLHYTIESPIEHHKQIGERYAPLGAEKLIASGRRVGILKLFVIGPLVFFQTFFLKLGILDGVPGFTISWFAAHHAFLKYLLAYRNSANR